MILFFSFLVYHFLFFFRGALHKVSFCSKFPLITHSILMFFCSVLMNRSFYFFQQISWKEQRLLNVFKCCIWAKEQLFRSNFATDFCGVNDVTWVGFFFILWILTLRCLLFFFRLSCSFFNFATFFWLFSSFTERHRNNKRHALV